ncbi:UDP-N-acetylmuramoyl-tripeptide--D-alanyl-D-alanine ligase [Thalassotalea maritima]|uniref:UDP-N-acetylmuramoyl-tripeptide--D-alanyl-D- alanine ligase n=1 Tax=Thalassotalea maritima TaxID=3242416 RepID=UPI0035297721
MIPLSINIIADVVDGVLSDSSKAERIVTSVSTDSRQLQADDMFIALKGPNFDGHGFVAQAASLGCPAAIVEVKQDADIAQIVVADCYQALGKLAAYVKQQVNPKTVAITGSSGKTTVKEMVAAILSPLGSVLATKGNFNNEIGVPLTLLRLEPHHQYAVVELGANHLGEIAYTTSLTKPDVALINNIAAAHLEGFGDLTGVARAKGEIFSGLGDNGVALYNQDTPFTDKWQWRLQDKSVRRFSCVKQADCYCTDVELSEQGFSRFCLNTYKGNIDITVPVPGRHNVCNAVAAAAIALEFGATLEQIRDGLENMRPVKGRLNITRLAGTVTLIDDTYNANVESTKAAVDLLATYQGHKIFILGDLAELGADARAYHQQIGEHALTSNIDNMVTLGVLSQSASDVFAANGQHFSNRQALLTKLAALIDELDSATAITILVKGSRSARMELVVEDIKQWRKATQEEQGTC